MKILLDYVFPISVITPTPEASTAFLKQACLVCLPKSGQEGNVGEVFECSSMSEVAVRTDNTNAQQLFNAGMSKVFIMLMEDLDLEDAITENDGEFFTVLISDDFDKDDFTLVQADCEITISSYANLVSGTDDTIAVAGVTFTAQAGAAVLTEATFQAATSNEATATSLAAQINAHLTAKALVVATVVGAVVTVKAKDAGAKGNLIPVAYTDNDTNVGITIAGLSGGKLAGGQGLLAGTFKGVIGVSSDDLDFLAAQAVITDRAAFFAKSSNGAKNMCYAFGSMLANRLNWLNQQFIPMPFDDEVDELGDAESFFDDKINFVISDSEFGTRLALFCAGGRAIVAPYIIKNFMIDLQSTALNWISGNQPQYTLKEAALLENRLIEDVVKLYVETRKWLPAATVSIGLEEDNFVAAGNLNIAAPTALWRVFSELRQTL